MSRLATIVPPAEAVSYLVNWAVAASLVCIVGLVAVRLCRRGSAPLRHGILLCTLALTLLSPAAVWLAGRNGLAIVRLDLSDRSDAPPAALAKETVPRIADPAASPSASGFTPGDMPPLGLPHGRLEMPSESAFSDPPGDATTAKSPLPATTPEASPPVAGESSRPLPEKSPRWAWWQAVGALAAWLWAIGAAVALLRLAWGCLALARFCRRLTPLSDPALETVARQAARAVGLRKPPPLFLSRWAGVPLSIGLTRPAIVLPEAMQFRGAGCQPASDTATQAGLQPAPRPDPEQLQAVLLHEMAHIARRDHWVGLGQRLATVLFWWNPLVYRVGSELAELREEICDNYVMSVHGGGPRLARILVDLAERATIRPPLPSTIGILEPRRTGLAGRITRLLNQERNMETRMDLRSKVFVSLVGLVMLTGMASIGSLRFARARSEAAGADAPAATEKEPAATPVTPDRTDAASPASPDAAQSSQAKAVQVLARVGNDVILSCDVLAGIDDMLAGVKDRIPPEKFAERRAKLVQDVTAGIGEFNAHGKDPDPVKGMSPSHRALIEQLVRWQVAVKLIYQDFLAKAPKEALPAIQETVNRHFDETQLKALMKRENVTSPADLETALRAKGSSLDREKRIFMERVAAREWIEQKIKGERDNEEIPHEEMLNWYQAHIKEFEERGTSFSHAQKEIKEKIKSERREKCYKEFVRELHLKHPVWTVFERPLVQEVIIVGNDTYLTSVLRKEAELKVGDAADPSAVENGRRKIEEYYKNKGHSKVRVTVLEGNKAGDLRAVFVVDEGPRQRISWLNFVGNHFVSSARLKTIIKSHPLYSYLVAGEVDRKQIDEDVGRLTAYYRGLGFFKARVGRELEFNEKQNWLTINFVIDEGPRYTVRNVTFLGNKKVDTNRLLQKLRLLGGQPFDQNQQNLDLHKLRDEYGGDGYVFAKIEADIRLLEKPGTLDIVYKVEEGARYRARRTNIEIKGENPHTQITTVLNRLSETVLRDRPRGNCSISGKVVSASTGEPVGAASMHLSYEPTYAAIFINTAADGTFTFKDIAKGPFSLRTSHTAGYQDAIYNPEGKPGEFPRFLLADGEHRSGIVLKAKPACRISGKLLDEKGKIPEQIGTWDVLAWFTVGGTEYQSQRADFVGADGSYVIDGLSDKPVYVMAINWPAAKEGNAYPPIYYPGTFSRSDAKLITFDKQQRVDNIDIRLQRAGGLVLQGTVLDEAGKPVSGAFVVAHRRDMYFDVVTAYSDEQGRYQIHGLGDGEFLVHVDAAHRGFVRTHAVVDLSKTSKNAGHDFTLHRGALISGRLVDEKGNDWQIGESEGDAKIVKDQHVTDEQEQDSSFFVTGFRNKYTPHDIKESFGGFFARGEGDYHRGEMIFPTKSTFIIQGMMPGQTRLSFSPLKEGQKVLKILQGGRNVMESGIDTKPGQEIKDVTIVIGTAEATNPSGKTSAEKPAEAPRPKLTAEESRMAVLLFQGWKDARDRLASGVFRARGHLSSDSRDDPHCEGPLDYFCAVDYRKGRLRFDHDVPVVDRDREESGKVIGHTFRELGKYYQVPTRTAEWSNRQKDVVYLRKPGTPAVDQAAPFDVRCIGMMNLADFERFTKFEPLGRMDPQALTNVSAAGNGVWRVSWTAAQGVKFALWLNRDTGYGPIRYEARWPDGHQPPIELSEATWTQVGNVWVPKSVKMERNEGPERSRLDLVFEWKSVNQPIADDLFEFKSLVPPGQPAQVISFESGKGILLERINHSGLTSRWK